MKNNTYKEYEQWLEDNADFIEELDEKAPNLSMEFELEFYVLDALYQLAQKDEKLDEDHDDVFFLGFDYLSYVYQLLQLFSEQLYNNDLKLMDEQVNSILSYIYMDVLILNVELELDLLEIDYEEIGDALNNYLEKAEHLIIDKKEIPNKLIESLELEVGKIIDDHDFEVYLDDILLLEYAEEHGIIELEEQE